MCSCLALLQLGTTLSAAYSWHLYIVGQIST